MFEKLKKRKAEKLRKEESARGYEQEHRSQLKEFNGNKTFSEEEKMVCDIIIKSDFSQCEFDHSSYFYHTIVYNNIRLVYTTAYKEFHKNAIFTLSRRDNKHMLKKIRMGRAKADIIKKIFDDKYNAYISNSIVSALQNKSANKNDCPYCNTKNADNKGNCINCGAVLQNNS